MASSLLKRSARLAIVATATTLGATALVVLTTVTAEAAAPPCQRVYFSGVVNEAIPDNNTTSAASTIDVPEDGLVVSDIDVSVNIHHTFDSDLTVDLESFTDAVGFREYTNVIAGAGFGEDNFLGTVLDDEATTPVGWGEAPFTGRFTPTNRLSLLDGETGGFYRMFVTDRISGDSGTFDDWSLTLRYVSCDFDSDGVEDHSDKCLGLAASTATGCPVTSRSVTSTYRLGKFRGALSSPVAGCTASRPVTIWKVRAGADRKIGTATTASDGRYRLTRAKRAGRYYATSPLAAVTGVAQCPAVTSAIFRIR
jgi:subtilisin-like proprotein convertase family protein